MGSVIAKMSRVHAHSFVAKATTAYMFSSFFKNTKTAQQVAEQATDLGYDFTADELKTELAKLSNDEFTAVTDGSKSTFGGNGKCDASLYHMVETHP